jgi:hypothetical protein
MDVTPGGRLDEGRHALEAAHWEEARAAFEAALADEETPDALEGLGLALWFLGGVRDAIAAREQAVEGYARDGGCDDAARLAVWVSHQHLVGGRASAARGWLARAERASSCGASSGTCSRSRRSHALASTASTSRLTTGRRWRRGRTPSERDGRTSSTRRSTPSATNGIAAHRRRLASRRSTSSPSAQSARPAHGRAGASCSPVPAVADGVQAISIGGDLSDWFAQRSVPAHYPELRALTRGWPSGTLIAIACEIGAGRSFRALRVRLASQVSLNARSDIHREG